MPRGDRTGPMGEGPMTGRAAGYCAGYNVAGCDNPAGGRGMGRGWGMGRGRGRGLGFGRGMRYGAPAAAWGPAGAPDEVQALREQVADMQAQLNAVLNRLEGRSGDDKS